MKKMKFSGWLSLLLILSFLLSFGVVFVSADGSEEETTNEPKADLMIHRTFDEGWDFTNGLVDVRKENNFFIDYEMDAAYNYNYFFRMEALNAQDGYSSLTLTPAYKNATVVAFDAKSDDYPDNGKMYYRSTDSVTHTLFDIRKGRAQLWGIDMGPVDENWRHYVLIFDWDEMKVTLRVEGPGLTNDFGVSVDKLERQEEIPHGKGLDYIRIGQASGCTVGLSWCLDNFSVHNGPKRELTEEEFKQYGYGTTVNVDAAKTVTILGSGSSQKTDVFENMLCMKVGVNYALLKQKRVPIFEDGKYGAPVKIDGTIYVPLEILLTYIGFPYYVHPDGLSYDISTGTSATYLSVGRDTAVVNGKRINLNAAPTYITQKVNGEDKSYLAIAMDDIELLFSDKDHPESSVYLTYDELGLIIVCGVDNVMNRNNGLTDMMNLMKKFIFDNPTGEQLYNDVKTNTNNFQHPYLLVHQDRFDELKAIYDAQVPTDPNYTSPLRPSLLSLVRQAYNMYNKWAVVDDDGNYISLKPERIANGDLKNPNDVLGNFGYDPAGGRLNASSSMMNQIQNWAFAYQLTRDINFAYAAYDYAIEMGKWDHWGPAHFLNCADATAPIALAFDWLYNAFDEISKTDPTRSPVAIADIIYTHGVYQGYNAVVNNRCDWPNTITNSFRYDNFTNNWNAVCCSGMVMGALAILQYDQYKEQSCRMSELSLFALGDHGLGQYAPDGSYIESPSYWSYGTNTFFRLCASLESAAGTDYGFMDCWGIDTTCYFAVQSESSDYVTWNFHDGGAGSQDGSYFMYVGTHFGDENLCAIRAHQLANGKSFGQYDLLFYNDEASKGKPQMSLGYYMQGAVQAYTIRSSWEKKSLFAGIMGGEGNVAHGNIDSGNFIYENLGTRWLVDLGGDEYNTYGYFSTNYRYRYYRLGTEGSNVMMITSEQDVMPYGQHLNENTMITKHHENEYGGYAILDNLPAFRGFVTSAERGVMLTNNNKTVVVQDEVLFEKVEDVYWFAHTLKAYNPEISADGKTAYLSRFVNGVKQVIRLSLVTKIRGLKFEEMSVYEYVLDTTFRTDLNESVLVYNKSPEYNRSQFTKFAIHGENVLNFNVAVVIEEVDKVNSTMPVNYTWTPMAQWEPYESMTPDTPVDPNPSDPDIDPDYSNLKDTTYTRSDMLDAMDIFHELDEEGKIFTSQIKDGYLALYASFRVMENNPTMSGNRYQEALQRYKTYKAKYDQHLANVNATQKSIRTLGYSLIGMY